MTLSIAMAEENGYQNIEDCIREGVTLKAGDKVYAQYMKKTLALFYIGTKPLTEGMNILGAHVDSPRLDVKQNPLYEDTQMAYLDTHYYGGVKKYQWVTIPLAIHGVVVKKTEQSCRSLSVRRKISSLAMLEAENPERTGCCILADKEEIGNMGATGMQSNFFEDMVAEVLALTGEDSPVKVRRVLRNSCMLSSDVSAAYDPLYPEVFEKKNTVYFGRGLVLNKYQEAVERMEQMMLTQSMLRK